MRIERNSNVKFNHEAFFLYLTLCTHFFTYISWECISSSYRLSENLYVLQFVTLEMTFAYP